jgi:light-regulated signal transduction histidine kinase (bacteriophytochrome)
VARVGRPSQDASEVDLGNCDREPIHIPGAIQPHGVLLGFDRRLELVTASANLPEALHRATSVRPADLGPAVEVAVRAIAADPRADVGPITTTIGSKSWEVIVHGAGDTVFVELEPVPPDAPDRGQFAWMAQRALDVLQRVTDIQELLDVATREIRRLTGFDRVMAYRFRHDDSGEVIAEDRRRELEPFLGLRYPATDIPAQARRLYVENPLRMIVDVRYRPTPLVPSTHPQTNEPFDLGNSVLRSVSPIHVEYLTNMGVAASMSVSIVIGGRLWGLIACHHLAPRFVPHAVRMACRLVSQTLGLLVERAEAATLERRRVAAMDGIRSLLLAAAREDDPIRALTSGSTAVRDLVDATGVAVSYDSRVETLGEVPTRAALGEIIAWLDRQPDREVFACDDLPARLPEIASPRVAAGLLAACFDQERRGYVLWFRPEEVETVRWAGNPNKVYPHGTHGARLSPRGSFAEWIETVRGRARPWLAIDREIAATLRNELLASALRRSTELERTRDLFIGIVSHDLRSPLNAIGLAAELISEGRILDRATLARVGDRLTSSTHRMRRMVDQLLDFSRLQSGLGLGIETATTDLHALARSIVDESCVTRPGAEISLRLSGPAEADIDGDRIGQLLANLLSNARHHGAPSAPIIVDVTGDERGVTICVTNRGPTIPRELLPRLFDPYKPESLRKRSNRGGLGLGLHIVKQIVDGHGGSIDVTSTDDQTCFTVAIPRGRSPRA